MSRIADFLDSLMRRKIPAAVRIDLHEDPGRPD